MKLKNAINIYKWILITLLFLNVVDAYATFYWVTNGIGEEKNPIMRELLQLSPIAFMCLKLIFINLAIGYLWLCREKKLAHILITPVFLIYLYTFVIHCNIAMRVF